jgi:hypothetical protein
MVSSSEVRINQHGVIAQKKVGLNKSPWKPEHFERFHLLIS